MMHNPMIKIQCVTCNTEIEVDLTEIACQTDTAWDARTVPIQLERRGWSAEDNDIHKCPSCLRIEKQKQQLDKEDKEYDTAVEEGHAAFNKGMAENDNPHINNHNKYVGWKFGWLEELRKKVLR